MRHAARILLCAWVMWLQTSVGPESQWGPQLTFHSKDECETQAEATRRDLSARGYTREGLSLTKGRATSYVTCFPDSLDPRKR